MGTQNGKNRDRFPELTLHHAPDKPVDKGKAATHEQGQEDHHLQAGGDQLKSAVGLLVLLGPLILPLAVNPLHLIRQLRGNTPAVKEAEHPFQEVIGKYDGNNGRKYGCGIHGMFLLNIKLLAVTGPGVFQRTNLTSWKTDPICFS